MNQMLAALFGFLTAMSSATGGFADAKKMPDRPAIVQSVPASVSTKNAAPLSVKADNKGNDPAKSTGVELQGAITNINGNTITVNGVKITLDAKTKVEGKPQVGVLVRVEGINQNGNVIAKEIQVAKSNDSNTTTVKPSDDKSKDEKVDKPDDNDAKEDQNDVDKSPNDKGDDKSGDKSPGDTKDGSKNDGSKDGDNSKSGTDNLDSSKGTGGSGDGKSGK